MVRDSRVKTQLIR